MQRAQTLESLARRLLELRLPRPLRVAIDGIDASGKTWLADELAQVLRAANQPVIRASIDGFHHPRALRYRRGKESPEGYYADSFDYPGLRCALLEPLGPGGSRRYRTAIFDYRQDCPLDQPEQVADPNAILILDGIFLLRPELAENWEVRIFVQVSFETSLERALRRDAPALGGEEQVRQRYQLRYFPAQRLYLQRCDPLHQADAVLFNDEPQTPRLEWRKD